MPDELNPAPTETQKSPGESLVAKLNEQAPLETEVVETPKPTLAERVKAELGFDNVADDNDAAERVLAFAKEQQQRATEQERIARALAERTPAEQQTGLAPPPQTQSKPWDIPKIDLALIQQYKTADGWKPETPAAVRQEAEAYTTRVTQWTQLLATNPEAALGPMIEDRAMALVERILSEREGKQREQQTLQKVTAENPWLYEKNPITGQLDQGRLSAEGQRMDAWMKEAANWGASFEQQWQYATEKRELEQLRAKHAQVSALETNDQKKRALLTSGLPERTGSIPKPGEGGSQNRRLSPGQKLVQALQTNGVPLTP